MNLEYLQSFYITVKCNSISKAASKLHLTQPGLSIQLKNLEKEFDTSLLIRSNKGVELTEEGKVVFNYADTILSMKNNVERDLKSLQQNRPKLLIGSCKSIGEYALPCALFIFKKLHKELDISMEVANSPEVIKKLCDHSINIGIIQDNPKKNGIDTKYLASDELILVGNSNNTTEYITIEELKNLPLILREENSNARYLVKNAFQEKGILLEDLNVIYSLNSPEAIKSSILSGKGVSFLPKIIVKNELKKGLLKHITIDEIKIEFNYYLIHRQNYIFNKYEQMFVDFITSSKKAFC
ncbi:LysR family transcriptional regulator [Clostridium fermenticellae]|uniref:LysR family transcriptional regulator n=1 Tax=Clostridium fermenticellae TaxID=2068654 RepID=A0A386H1U7_9CLOT|nr:LysR family transcriptional regulator [Clostridium fermenticellae]AYD39548.1 LysR family transcriptional regulator [Clostridium fermenticellae]